MLWSERDQGLFGRRMVQTDCSPGISRDESLIALGNRDVGDRAPMRSKPMDGRHMGRIGPGMLPHGHPHGDLPRRTADHKTPVTHQIGKRGNRLTSFRSFSHLNQTGLRRFPEVEMVDLALFRSDGEKLCPTPERERRNPTRNAGREIDLRDRRSGGSIGTGYGLACGQPEMLVLKQRGDPNL